MFPESQLVQMVTVSIVDEGFRLKMLSYVCRLGVPIFDETHLRGQIQRNILHPRDVLKSR